MGYVVFIFKKMGLIGIFLFILINIFKKKRGLTKNLIIEFLKLMF